MRLLVEACLTIVRQLIIRSSLFKFYATHKKVRIVLSLCDDYLYPQNMPLCFIYSEIIKRQQDCKILNYMQEITQNNGLFSPS
ncbi:MAG: hypothetical protein COB51_10330 [Moraxellaceae bacterium]|nr:MAG: hypothetical protein COB51_10330 [Moraxellaceae bacterium]